MEKKIIIFQLFIFLLFPSCKCENNQIKMLANDKDEDECVMYEHIIIDKDGYTNVREEPNAESKIVGRINKYQIFFSLLYHCENDLPDTKNWLPIYSDYTPDGYIYKKNILSLDKLSHLENKGEINFQLLSDTTATIIKANDSIQITMKLQPYNRQNHEGWIYGGVSDAYESYMIKKQIGTEIKEIEVFDNDGVKTEIEKIEIIYNNQKTILPQDSIYNYCDITYMVAFVGFDGELYLGIGGGGDAGQYSVWFSIVNGEILYKTMPDFCW